VLHFSDVHVEAPLAGVPWMEILNKRLLGIANLRLRRGRHFQRVLEKLEALIRFSRRERVDLVLCTGDYTALGLEPELKAARVAIEPFTLAPLGYVTVPGNHDVYLVDPGHGRRFDRYFGDLLRTDLPELAIDGVWPMVRLVNEDIAVVAVDSARPNPQPWRSSGRIPDAQLEALERIVRDDRIARRFVFVMTHYALRLRDGSRDKPWHGLENADALLRICAPLRGAIVHGHVHWRYDLRIPGIGPHVFGAGSATHEGREGIWLFEIEPAERTFRALPGRWTEGGYVLDVGSAIDVAAPGPSGRASAPVL